MRVNVMVELELESIDKSEINHSELGGIAEQLMEHATISLPTVYLENNGKEQAVGGKVKGIYAQNTIVPIRV
jgi:hypothetical protein